MKTVTQAYIAGELNGWYRVPKQDVRGALQTPRTLDRLALVAALRAYYQHLGIEHTVVAQQLEKLAHPNSRTIVTGQQTAVLLGPALTVHKAADALLLAQQLDMPDTPVVPIFWLATQDHDTAEVASVSLLGQDEVLRRLNLALPEGIPVGNIPLDPAWVEQTLAFIRDSGGAFHADVLQMVAGAAQLANSYADWFAHVLHQLLGNSGIILFDPMFPALAALFVPAIERELQAPLHSSHQIEEAAEELLRQGITPGLRRPAGGTNLFLQAEDGIRRLLRFEQGEFFADRAYSTEELHSILLNSPQRITPAAGLRPILQDTVLPTAIFVVGPGELAYATQLRGVYQLHQVLQPLLWPRLSITWIEPPVRRILQRYQLTAAQYQAHPQGTLEQLLLVQSGMEQRFALSWAQLELQYQQLEQAVLEVDVTLEKAVQRSHQRSQFHVERLKRKTARALSRQKNDYTQQFQRLQLHLLPYGHLQEREVSFFSFWLRHGKVLLSYLLKQSAGTYKEVDI